MFRYENNLINLVCNYYDVKVYHVFSKIKFGEIPNARTVLIQLYKEKLKLSIIEISHIFGMNEKSVYYHLNKFKNNKTYYNGVMSRIN